MGVSFHFVSPGAEEELTFDLQENQRKSEKKTHETVSDGVIRTKKPAPRDVVYYVYSKLN